MKRIALFLVTNLAIMVVLSIVASVFGANQWLTANGLDLQRLLVFSAIFGIKTMHVQYRPPPMPCH